MTAPRIAGIFLLPVAILFSCNNKKENNSIVSAKEKDQPSIDSVKEATAESISLNAYSDAWQQAATQTFIAASKKTTVLTGKKGLKITVNPAVLEKEDGSPIDADITVKIIELTTNEELFKGNAATMSNGRLLMSGGSYFVGMECNGKAVGIRNGNHLQMEFPKIKENEMELFYGNREATGNMNWTVAQNKLLPKEKLSFEEVMKYGSYNLPYPDAWESKPFKSKFMMYKSLENKIFYEDRLLSVRSMVKILQKKGVDKKIDTVRIPVARSYADQKGKIQYYYDTMLRYRVMSECEIQDEKEAVANAARVLKQQQEANQKYTEEWQRVYSSNTLTSQIQNYYAPSEVTQLGWINCDRFYNNPQNTEIPVELPYTFSNPDIQYFLIYKSFNGLMSGRIQKNAKEQYALSNLPQGQAVTLVGFTKSDGKLYQCKEDFVIQPGKTLKPSFNVISEEEMRKIFGNNVKI